ncbi:glycosyltransferase family 9 protein [Amylibacter sp.]|nr:glycosyltransferase family 9 protein [Amylibacter sp.]
MKILISAYTGLGNFILKTPMINRLHELYPDCKIDLVCGLSWGAEKVLEHSNLINHVYWLPLNSTIVDKRKHLKSLANNGYDLIFLPFDSTPTFLLWGANFYFSASKIVAHFNIYSLGRLIRIKRMLSFTLLSNVQWVPVLHGRHEIDLNLDLIDVLSYQNYSANRDRKTIVTYDLATSVSGLPDKYIVLQPSARNGVPSPKTWPISQYHSLAQQWLKKHPDYGIILVGDSGDLNALIDHPIFKLDGVVNMIGDTDFSQLCMILKSASAVVANDSGIMHISDALETSLVALYGPTDNTRTRPLSASSKILSSQNDCYCNCYAFKASEDSLLEKFGEDYCMKDITTSNVISTLESMVG